MVVCKFRPATFAQKVGQAETYRFEKNLGRVSKNEGKPEDNCGERYERRQGVGRIEDEEGDEHDDYKPNTD